MADGQEQASVQVRRGETGRRVRRLLVVLLFAVPPAAHPYTLERLLQMSLEQLLQLEIRPAIRLSDAAPARPGGHDAS